MAHAQKPDSVFQRNGPVHLYRRGCQFSRVLTFLEWGSGENDCSNTGWTVPSQTENCWLPTPFASFPFTSPPVRHRVPSDSVSTLPTRNYIKLLPYIVAIQIQAIVVSWKPRLFFFVVKVSRQAFCPFLHNDFCLSVFPRILAGQKISWVGETSDIITWCAYRYCIEDARKFPQFYCSNAHFVSREANYSFLLRTTDTVSSHYVCSLHLHYTHQQPACGLPPGEYFGVENSYHRLNFMGSWIFYSRACHLTLWPWSWTFPV